LNEPQSAPFAAKTRAERRRRHVVVGAVLDAESEGAAERIQGGSNSGRNGIGHQSPTVLPVYQIKSRLTQSSNVEVRRI
jgi:hypothetical protein